MLDAAEFLKAGQLVLNRTVGVSLPAYFLLARSVELSLKAFLLHQGVSAKDLASKKFGHNLSALLNEATSRGLQSHVCLDSPDVGALGLLSDEYLSTRLGYRDTNGTYYLPRIDLTESVATKLVTGIGSVCV